MVPQMPAANAASSATNSSATGTRRLIGERRQPEERGLPSSRSVERGAEAIVRGGLAVTRQEVVHPGRPGESSGCLVITHPDQEAWMNIHKNARLTPYRRQELVARVERGEPVTAVARAFGVSRQTARKWMVRKRTEVRWTVGPGRG